MVHKPTGPSRRRSWPPILALLALNGLVGIGVWHALNRPIDTTPIKGPAVDPATERPTAAGSVAPLSTARSVADLPETAKRPLFAANRRPWVEKPAPQVAAAKMTAPQTDLTPLFPANQLLLIGVMQGNRNTAARVLIRVGAETQGTWIRVGESIRGWKVREVTSDSAIVETRGERAELALDLAPSVNPPQQPQGPQLYQPPRR